MEHQANYLTVDELNFRKALFEANQALVDQLNSNPNQTARFETNQFSDKTKAEKNAVLGLIGDLAPNPPQRSLAAIKSKQEVYYDNETDTYWSLFLEYQPFYYWKTFSWETYTCWKIHLEILASGIDPNLLSLQSQTPNQILQLRQYLRLIGEEPSTVLQ